MGIIPVKTPIVFKKLLPEYVWNISTTKKVVFLTFDDGPTPEITDWTLEMLKQYNAKATFFCIGNNIKNHPGIFQKIIAEGHTIGNHTNNHIKGWKTKTKIYVENVLEAQKVIEIQKTNRALSGELLFRPPYGQIKPKQGKALMALGYKIIMWHVLSFDWDKNTSKEQCLSNVLEKSKSGSIVVFHDSLKASKNLKYVLPKTLDYFSKQGYSFKAIDL